LNKKCFLTITLILIVLLTTAFSIKEGNSGTFIMGEDLIVSEDEIIRGSTAVLFGDVVVNGRIEGDLAAIFGDVTINGTVDGNVAAILGDITVESNGVIEGSAAAVVGEVERLPGSVIEGEIASIDGPFNINHADFIPLLTITSIVGLMVFFGISSLLLVLIPDRMMIMAENAPVKIWRRFGIGIASYLMFIPAIIALAITIIGVFLIPLFIAVFFLTAFIGMASLKIAIGRRITGKLDGRGAPYIYLLVGSILVFVLPFIPILGWIVYMFAASLALGIVLDTRFGKPNTKTI